MNEHHNYAFIDVQNVYLSIKEQGWKIDWPRFRIYLKEHYQVAKAFIFIGYIESNNDLYLSLKNSGFICIFKPVLRYSRGFLKGNVDAEMVLQIMHEFKNFYKAVIVTGDGDFYCVIRYLKIRNKLRVVLIPNFHKYSALIKKVAKKDIAFMNNLIKKIGKK